MKYILLFLCSINCFAVDFHILDLDEVFIDYKNYSMLNDKARNLLIYPEFPKESMNIGINMSVFTYLYWNNVIESITTGSQYRGVGLETRLGAHITENIEFGIWHHSQHVLDRPPESIQKYPSEDAIELKIYLLKTKNSQSLF